MRPDEYVTYDATGLAELVARGDVDAAEVLEAAVAVIDERNPEVNAFVARCDEDARAAVAAGLPDGPLRGVPYAIKDLNAQVAGLPGTNGCRLFTDVIAPVDSEFVAGLRRAGMVISGIRLPLPFARSLSHRPRRRQGIRSDDLWRGPLRLTDDTRRWSDAAHRDQLRGRSR